MIEMFSHEFMVRAYIAGTIIAILAPMLGCFVVLRRASMLSDTLAHISLMGVGLGILLQFSPEILALVVASIAALLIETVVRKSNIGMESVQALFLSGGLAAALVFVHSAKTQAISFESFLFGNILTVTTNDILWLGIFFIGSVFVIGSFWWKMLSYSLDESFSEAIGLKGVVLRSVLALLIAFTISLSLQIIGGLLIGATIVIPVLSAMQWTKSFRETMILAVFFGIVSLWSGLFISYEYDIPSGSAIVLFSILLFLISFSQKALKRR
jgi:zinc transport system permease protein